MSSKPKAVVLLSGGMDSATTLAVARSEGFQTYALTFRYGQRHEIEIESARKVASILGAVEHHILDIDLRLFGGSALTTDIPIPKGRLHRREPEKYLPADEIPVTYVPARNTIFLSCALAWMEVLGASDIFIGVNALDYSGYPDCRPEFIRSFEHMARLATKAGVQGQLLSIHVPLIDLSKKEIVRKGLDLDVDFSLTSTCYDPSPAGACGACDACLLRLKGFEENRIPDPLPYR